MSVSLPVLLLAGLSVPALCADSTTIVDCGTTHFENALVVAIDADDANLSVRDCGSNPGNKCAVDNKCPLIKVKVDDLAIRAKLKSYQSGDHIRLDITPNAGAGDGAALKDFRGQWSIPVSLEFRFVIMIVCALLVYLPAVIVTGGHPLEFIVGMDNRYSNSKAQVALWFWIAISTYVAAWVLRVWLAGWDFAGLINIPQNLLLISGLSALTYGGAKAITTSKANDADAGTKATADAKAKTLADAKAALETAKTNWEGKKDDLALKEALEAAQSVVANAMKAMPQIKTTATNLEKRFVQNLVQNDQGGFDFGDFQMLVVTLLAVATYLMLFLHFFDSVVFSRSITLPDIDTTILSIFGLGQGAYIAKKAAGNAGGS